MWSEAKNECIMQGSSEVLFRKVKFWDGGGQDAPPVFHVDGVNYLYVKVSVTHSMHHNDHTVKLPDRSLLHDGHCNANQHPTITTCAVRHFTNKQPVTSVSWVQDGGVLLCATTRENVSPFVVLELLRRIGGIIKVQPDSHHIHTLFQHA